MYWKLQCYDDLSNRVYVPNETEDLNSHVFNMTTRIKKSRTLAKHVSFKYECMLDGRKCNLNQKWKKDKCWCECKNLEEHRMCEETFFWNPATCSCKNDKYVENIIGDSVAISD